MRIYNLIRLTCYPLFLGLYLFSIPSTAECQLISSIGLAEIGQLMLSDSQFFTISFDLSPPYNAYFIKLTFGSSTTDWTNKLLWSTGTCPYVNYKAGSVLSNDGSKIYSFFPFGTTNYLYLAIFNASSGAVSNSRFKSSISWSAVYGIAQKGSYILISVLCSSYDLILFNSDLFTFNIKKSSGGYSLDSWLLDPQSGR